MLDDAETAQSTTGLPTNKLGVINGDSVYATGTGYTASANAGTTELGVKDVELKGDDAGNYILNSTSYTEVFNIQRNQLQATLLMPPISTPAAASPFLRTTSISSTSRAMW